MVVVVWYGFRFWYCVSCAVLCAVLIVVCVVVVMFGVIYMWFCDCCGCGDVWLWRGVVLVAVWLCCGWWVWWSVSYILSCACLCVCPVVALQIWCHPKGSLRVSPFACFGYWIHPRSVRVVTY